MVVEIIIMEEGVVVIITIGRIMVEGRMIRLLNRQLDRGHVPRPNQRLLLKGSKAVVEGGTTERMIITTVVGDIIIIRTIVNIVVGSILIVGVIMIVTLVGVVEEEIREMTITIPTGLGVKPCPKTCWMPEKERLMPKGQ